MASGLNITQLLADLNALVASGLSPRLVVRSDDGTVVDVGGDIVDQGGNPVGDTTRRYVCTDGRWRASHTRLHLHEAFQRRGFGRAFQRHSEVVYRAHGIGQIDLFAQEKGAYAWHSEGFQLAGSLERRRQQCVDIWLKYGGRRRASEALEAGHVTQEEFNAADKEFSRVERGDRDPMEPSEIAAIGANRKWRDAGGHEMWLGRLILTDSQWTGLKRM